MKKQTPAARCQYHTLKPDAPTLAGTLAKLLPSIAAAFLLPWDITEGCSHTCYQQVSAERFPCTQSCQQVSRSNLHLLRGLDERPTPSWAFFGQAISALLSSSPTSSATPSWVNTLHLPSSLPPSFSKEHFANPYASALAMLQYVPNLYAPPPAGLAPLSTLAIPKEPVIPLRTE